MSTEEEILLFRQLLKKIRKQYRLFLLSNTNAIHVSTFEKMYRERFNNESLGDLFEKLYYSHRLGLRKPSKEIYEFVLRDSNLQPNETLFIDDAEVNTRAAEQTGMQIIHLKPGKTILDLDL